MNTMLLHLLMLLLFIDLVPTVLRTEAWIDIELYRFLACSSTVRGDGDREAAVI